MSSSSIYGIRKNYTGEEILEYKNSWCFSPIIWGVLPDKYIHDYIQTPYGYKKGIIGMDGNDVWTRTNKAINKCDNTPDRICWEMSNQQIFHTSDKQIISDSIMQFLKQNDTYDVSEEDNVPVLKREHIIERFTEIANDILSIDENEFHILFLKIQQSMMALRDGLKNMMKNLMSMFHVQCQKIQMIFMQNLYLSKMEKLTNL